ncbi:MAG: tail completion protein gp17 [Pseudomonadota bacterium]
MSDAGTALYRAIRDVLQNDAKLQALAKAPVVVADQASPSACPRTVRIAGKKSWPWRSATFEGSQHQLVIEAEIEDEDDGARAKAFCDAVILRLNDAELNLPGHALIDLTLASAETRFQPAHVACRLVFDALTLDD